MPRSPVTPDGLGFLTGLADRGSVFDIRAFSNLAVSPTIDPAGAGVVAFLKAELGEG